MALPFPAHRFDAAVMALVIFFVPEPAKGLAEMVRVVAPGGIVAAYAWDMMGGGYPGEPIRAELKALGADRDRKSTRLNSSHQIISYAVVCLKKKKHP